MLSFFSVSLGIFSFWFSRSNIPPVCRVVATIINFCELRFNENKMPEPEWMWWLGEGEAGVWVCDDYFVYVARFTFSSVLRYRYRQLICSSLIGQLYGGFGWFVCFLHRKMKQAVINIFRLGLCRFFSSLSSNALLLFTLSFFVVFALADEVWWVSVYFYRKLHAVIEREQNLGAHPNCFCVSVTKKRCHSWAWIQPSKRKQAQRMAHTHTHTPYFSRAITRAKKNVDDKRRTTNGLVYTLIYLRFSGQFDKWRLFHALECVFFYWFASICCCCSFFGFCFCRYLCCCCCYRYRCRCPNYWWSTVHYVRVLCALICDDMYLVLGLSSIGYPCTIEHSF